MASTQMIQFVDQARTLIASELKVLSILAKAGNVSEADRAEMQALTDDKRIARKLMQEVAKERVHDRTLAVRYAGFLAKYGYEPAR